MPPYILHENIPYTRTNRHPRQVLDLYLPAPSNGGDERSAAAGRPARSPIILYIHGGAFRFGSKEESTAIPLRQIQHGYAIAAINYRRSGEALFPAMIEDCKSAVRFLRSTAGTPDQNWYDLDPSRTVVFGDSAGGHAAAFLGTTSHPEGGPARYDVGDHLEFSSAVLGVVDYYGPTDFLSMDAHLPEEWRMHNAPDSPESLYIGQPILDAPEKVREVDPSTYVEEMVKLYAEAGRQGRPEFFIAHGTSDKIVPAHQSTLLARELEKNRVTFEYLPVQGAGHDWDGISAEQQNELDERTDAFLKRLFDR